MFKVRVYSLYGIGTADSLAMVKKKWERRAAGPWAKAILVVVLFTGGGAYWDFFVVSVIIKQLKAISVNLCPPPYNLFSYMKYR